MSQEDRLRALQAAHGLRIEVADLFGPESEEHAMAKELADRIKKATQGGEKE